MKFGFMRVLNRGETNTGSEVSDVAENLGYIGEFFFFFDTKN